AAEPERGSAMQKKRHVAAELAGQTWGVDRLPGENRERGQRARAIARSAAEAAAHGDALGQSKMNARMNASGVEIGARGAKNQVVGDIVAAVDGQVRAAGVVILDGDGVGERDGLKNG